MTAFEFHKSSYSGSQGECVEVARNVPRTTAVRDSKRPAGPRITFDAATWDTFMLSLKDDGTAD
ncbi:DUF397 domain-containing protein [Streptomyces benahoarensis]|uniref:DUF397 domain-containing protein n=1 Tax=Streptomyces benahoarensis TaxID=2595054 RepID=A0A553ZLP8_9ACTN|nr:DUF397 domain-containing protein [Streptomyces benahoarensis]TSB22445.1 DUF397 domain-containing protein [Streptomyces benahoarensis]TSB42216.1 DUF397 domain-containing protein [Streptomyces benahoarensis]